MDDWVSEGTVKELLEGGGGLAGGWELSRLQKGDLLAVAPTAAMAGEVAKAGFILANGTLMKVARWSLF